MTGDLAAVRRQFAEAVGAKAHLPAALIDAFAAVPRERFLDPGPWLVWAEGQAGPEPTPDADPARVYVNASIAIDAGRQLFNGLPSFLGTSIAALGLEPRHRVLHIGAGLGYYSAVIGQLVGPRGAVLAVEVDPALATRAASLVLAGAPVEVRHGDGSGPFTGTFDAVLVNAGVTHPEPAWLDAVVPGGRIVLPLTAPLPMTSANIGKGMLVLLTREADGDFTARTLSYVAIYSAVGLRDEALGAQLAASMLRRVPFTRLTRRVHTQTDACFLHTADWCLLRG